MIESLRNFRAWVISDDVMLVNSFFSIFFFIFSGIWTLKEPDAILPMICLSLPLFFLGVPLILSFISAWNKTGEAKADGDDLRT